MEVGQAVTADLSVSPSAMQTKAWLYKWFYHIPGLAKSGELTLNSETLSFQTKEGQTVFDAPVNQVTIVRPRFIYNNALLWVKTNDSVYKFTFSSPWIGTRFGLFSATAKNWVAALSAHPAVPPENKPNSAIKTAEYVGLSIRLLCVLVAIIALLVSLIGHHK